MLLVTAFVTLGLTPCFVSASSIGCPKNKSLEIVALGSGHYTFSVNLKPGETIELPVKPEEWVGFGDIDDTLSGGQTKYYDYYWCVYMCEWTYQIDWSPTASGLIIGIHAQSGGSSGNTHTIRPAHGHKFTWNTDYYCLYITNVGGETVDVSGYYDIWHIV